MTRRRARRELLDLRRCRSRAAPPDSAVVDDDGGSLERLQPATQSSGAGSNRRRSGRGAIDPVEEVDVPVDLDAAADVPAGANQVEAGEGGAGVGPQQRQVATRPLSPGRVVVNGQLQLSAGDLAIEGAQA